MKFVNFWYERSKTEIFYKSGATAMTYINQICQVN